MSPGLAWTSSVTSSRRSLGVDDDAVGVVGEVAGDVLDDRLGASTGDAVALGRDLVVVVVFEVVVVVELVVGRRGVVASFGRLGSASVLASAAGASVGRLRSARASSASAAASASARPRRGCGRGCRRLGCRLRRPSAFGVFGRGLGRRVLAGLGLVRVPHPGDVEQLRDLLGRLRALAQPVQRALGVDRRRATAPGAARTGR